MNATATAIEAPTWTIRPPAPQHERRDGSYRGLLIRVNDSGWFLSGATVAGHAVFASRNWYGADRPDINAIADAALVAADELLAAGWHVHDWRQHDDGQRCVGCGAGR